MKLYRVVLPWCCAEVAVRWDGIIVSSSKNLPEWPGQSLNRLEGWVNSKGGRVILA